MSITVHIRPCPFCGSHLVDMCRTNANAAWVECCECGGSTDSSPSRDEAIELWNCREADDGTSATIEEDQEARVSAYLSSKEPTND